MGGWFTAGGSWVSADGKHSHMTQMRVQIGLKWAKSELDQTDLLGNSVQSAINAVEKWLYDIDNPLPGQPAKSMEEQKNRGDWEEIGLSPDMEDYVHFPLWK